MSANRARDTKPELLLRKALYHTGHRGYRINYRMNLGGNPTGRKGVSSPHVSKGTKGGDPTRRKGVPQFRTPHSEFRIPSVRPDITFVGKKLAIFVHGCYWHRQCQ